MKHSSSPIYRSPVPFRCVTYRHKVKKKKRARDGGKKYIILAEVQIDVHTVHGFFCLLQMGRIFGLEGRTLLRLRLVDTCANCVHYVWYAWRERERKKEAMGQSSDVHAKRRNKWKRNPWNTVDFFPLLLPLIPGAYSRHRWNTPVEFFTRTLRHLGYFVSTWYLDTGYSEFSFGITKRITLIYYQSGEKNWNISMIFPRKSSFFVLRFKFLKNSENSPSGTALFSSKLLVISY